MKITKSELSTLQRLDKEVILDILHSKKLKYQMKKAYTNNYEKLCKKYNVAPSEVTIDLFTGEIVHI